MKVFFITIEDVIKYDISHIKRIMPKRFAKANAYKQEKVYFGKATNRIYSGKYDIVSCVPFVETLLCFFLRLFRKHECIQDFIRNS